MVEENVIPSQEMEDRLLDLYVGLLKSGPGSSHCKFLKTITKHMEFQVNIYRLTSLMPEDWVLLYA